MIRTIPLTRPEAKPTIGLKRGDVEEHDSACMYVDGRGRGGSSAVTSPGQRARAKR
jgi:hypothetical protein